MSSDTIALLNAASQGLRRRPGLVECAALVRAVHLMAGALAEGDPVASAVANFAEQIGERMAEVIGDIAASNRDDIAVTMFSTRASASSRAAAEACLRRAVSPRLRGNVTTS